MTIKIGDRVGYRVRFLRSIGECHGEMAHARGVVTELERYTGGLTLASITWDQGDWPDRANVKNLARVGTMAFTSEDR